MARVQQPGLPARQALGGAGDVVVLPVGAVRHRAAAEEESGCGGLAVEEGSGGGGERWWRGAVVKGSNVREWWKRAMAEMRGRQ